MQQLYRPSGLKNNFILYGLFLVTMVVTSCKKEVTGSLPGNEADVSLNFFMASEVMETAYGPLQASAAVYVDKYQEQAKPVFASSGNKFPYFSFGFTDGHEYPDGNNGGINYVRYNAGSRKVMYTDINNTVVLDTTIVTDPQTYNTLYLADRLTIQGAAPEYKLVVAQDDNKAVEGKTGIRFIHLSADAGNITCNLQKANGDLVSTQAGEIAFGQVSAYQYFGTDETATGGLIRFTLSNAANGIKFNTGVVLAPGRNYVILISGFRNDQQRLVATRKDTDGSIKKEIVNISNNLRAQARRSY